MQPNGLLVIHSKEKKWSSENLMMDLKEFEIIKEISLDPKEFLTVWKMKKEYVTEMEFL